MEPSDEALCRRVATRDAGAFDLLVERHQDRAYRLAWSILRDPDEARDLSQEAFLRVYERAASFDERSRFSTWFHRILVNLCLDHRRRRSWWFLRVGGSAASEETDDALDQRASPGEDPDAEVIRKDLMNKLWKAAERLSPQQRTALALQVQEDLPTSEIAIVLGCSEATARVHLHRAVAALRKLAGGF